MFFDANNPVQPLDNRQPGYAPVSLPAAPDAPPAEPEVEPETPEALPARSRVSIRSNQAGRPAGPSRSPRPVSIALVLEPSIAE